MCEKIRFGFSYVYIINGTNILCVTIEKYGEKKTFGIYMFGKEYKNYVLGQTENLRYSRCRH